MNATLALIQGVIDRLGDCTSDGVVIFVNHWGRVCAKVSRKNGVIFAGWGAEVPEALENLLSEMTK